MPDIPCPHCSQLNETEREVCWACYKPLRQQDGPAAKARIADDVPEPLRERLGPGERLLWHGKPREDLRAAWWERIAGPAIGLLVGGFGALAVRGPFKGSYAFSLPGVIVLLFGIAFIAAGLYVGLYPFVDRSRRVRTFYGVTDRRVIAIEPWPWRWVMTLDLSRLHDMRITQETPDGSGNIEFMSSQWVRSNSTTGDYPEFDFIGDVHSVHDLILRARKEAAPAQPSSLEIAPQWSGVAAREAPEWMARLAVAAAYLGAAAYPLFVWCDLRELSRMGWRGIWSLFAEGSGVTGPIGYCAAPIVMAFVYFRARSFQTGARAVRNVDVAVMAGFAILGGVILCWDRAAGNRTGLHVALGLIALFVTSRRDPQGRGWRIDLR
ncbi:MAG: hypothetical protein NTX64_04815 [Elusimicrobia bacterium]|nr:hypothetical protein [Elusimicrobiota bacterium]